MLYTQMLALVLYQGNYQVA